VRPELQAANVKLELSVEPALPLLALDEAQIRQVLLNLLKNAREAMPQGGRVRLGLSSADGGVLLRVVDDGSGMTEEQRARIFDPFYTTKARGTGLGLPLSQQIVVAHGGTIRCQSAAGEGTVFEIWLPTQKSERARPRSSAALSAGESAE